MKKVKFRRKTYNFDDRFIPILIEQLKTAEEGTIIVNPFDRCAFTVENIAEFEDDKGQMIKNDKYKSNM